MLANGLQQAEARRIGRIAAHLCLDQAMLDQRCQSIQHRQLTGKLAAHGFG